MTKREPRWVTPFLRALVRTGEARAAAADAGIDHSTAYARRRAHGEFAARWQEALRAHAAAKARAEAEEIEAIKAGRFQVALSPGPSTIASSGNGPPPRSGEELVVSGGQLKRAGAGRWSKAKEKIFFEELALTANARRAAAAVGLTKNAVLQRRLRHPVFAAKWDAVVASAKVGIGLYLVEASNKTFDPDDLEISEETPKVTIDQAIKISQIGASRASAAGAKEAPNPFAEQAEKMSPSEIEAVRERVFAKLQRLRARERPTQIAQGWSVDEDHDVMVPPGWVRAGAPGAANEG
jgi:hypothetical protein